MDFRGSWFIRGVVRGFNALFGTDTEDRAGVGPFSLPSEHPFNRAAKVHDFYFTAARDYEKQGKPLSSLTLGEADMRLFRAWVATIYAETHPARQLSLMLDLCAYFPAARKVGRYFWRGPVNSGD